MRRRCEGRGAWAGGDDRVGGRGLEQDVQVSGGDGEREKIKRIPRGPLNHQRRPADSGRVPGSPRPSGRGRLTHASWAHDTLCSRLRRCPDIPGGSSTLSLPFDWMPSLRRSRLAAAGSRAPSKRRRGGGLEAPEKGKWEKAMKRKNRREAGRQS